MQERDKVETELQAQYLKKRELDSYVSILDALQKLTEQGIRDFKIDRLDTLKMGIEEVVDLVFPGENYIARLVPGTNNKGIDLLLGKYDSQGNLDEADIKDLNGRMCRQCIRFEIVTNIQRKLDALPILMDEAINSGDVESTEVLSTRIRQMVDQGCQIILTEHKEELFKNIPRRQINLTKDAVLDRIVDIEVVEYE